MRHSSSEGVHPEDINDFLNILREKGDLVEVEEEVSPRFEIGAVLGILGEKGGPAVLFHRVHGFPSTKIVGNLLGHRRRFGIALGVGERDLNETYLERRKNRIATVQGTGAPVKEKEISGAAVDLFQILPALIHHERDTSPYLTCAVTFACDPYTGKQSMGMHRVQIHSQRQMAICLETPPLARFLHRAEEMGKSLDVAVVIGPDPAVLIGAVTWVPEGGDKLEIAGALKGGPITTMPCKTVNLHVPFCAQYVIEGKIEPGNRAKEGIFGESSGIYVQGVMSPVINVTCVSHRAAPVYQALMPWSAEDGAFFDLCFGSDLLDTVKKDFSFVKDLHVMAGTVCGHVVVSLAPVARPLVRSAIAGILVRNPFVKMVVAVDDDIDIRNYREVEWALATRFQADRDLYLMPDVQGSVIDPSASQDGSACKMGLDATFPKDRAGSFERIRAPEEVMARATGIVAKALSSSRFCNELGGKE